MLRTIDNELLHQILDLIEEDVLKDYKVVKSAYLWYERVCINTVIVHKLVGICCTCNNKIKKGKLSYIKEETKHKHKSRKCIKYTKCYMLCYICCNTLPYTITNVDNIIKELKSLTRLSKKNRQFKQRLARIFYSIRNFMVPVLIHPSNSELVNKYIKVAELIINLTNPNLLKSIPWMLL